MDRAIYTQQWEEQHRQIVEIPYVPPRCQTGDKAVFQRPQYEPQQHQRRRQPQAVQRLPLDNAPVERKAPQGKKQQIERCPDMVHGGAADVEFRQHPTGIGYGDCRKHEDRRQQMLGGRFQEARPSLSSGCIRRHILIYSIKRRPPQLFPAGRERKRRTLLRASSRSRPVKISFMAAGGSLLTQEAGHHDAEANS